MDNFSILLVMSGVVIGSVAALAALLNARDRRAARLLGLVTGQFSPRALRSDVTVRASCGLLSRRSRVEVGLGEWAEDSTWPVVARLARVLPAHTKLLVDGALAAPHPARIRVETLSTPRPAGVTRSGRPVASIEQRAA